MVMSEAKKMQTRGIELTVPFRLGCVTCDTAVNPFAIVTWDITELATKHFFCEK